MQRRIKVALPGLLFLIALNLCAAETTLKAVTVFPRPNVLNGPFFDWMKIVNVKGKGLVQIQYIGGPETIPVLEQLGAMQRGVTTVFYGSASNFDGQVPETGALNASNKTAAELRRDGGQDILNKAFNSKANGEYLAWFGTGYTFHIYLMNEPRRTESGGADLRGLKIRGASIYRPFYDTQGATTVVVQVPEIYSALERGVIDGVGFPTVGMEGLGWEKLLKYRVQPGFWQGDMSIIINADTWKQLDPKARDLLRQTAIEAETAAYKFFLAESAKQEHMLRAAGVKEVDQSPADSKRYSSAAFNSLWSQLERRLSKDEVSKLRKVFYKE